MKRKKSGIFHSVKNLFKQLNRISKMEKEKKERKKQAKRSSIKPKGFLARRMGVITFWSLLGFMFLVVMVTIFGGNSSEASPQVVKQEKNYATSPEGVQFAENFAKEYFTWEVSDSGKDNRKKTMSKYLADGLDQYAGIKFGKLQWNATFKESEVKDVVEIADNVSQITLLVHAEFKKVGSNETKNIEKYFVVPVAYDGKTFGVYELPKFTYIQEDTTVSRVVSNKLNRAETSIVSDIKEFLPTFFKSYADDTKDKLNYLLTNENVTDGLQGLMNFDEVNSINVFEGEKPDTYVVFATVTFVEPQTNIFIETNYQLSVVKRDDRFIVSGIDDQNNKEVQSNVKEETQKASDINVNELKDENY